MRLASIALALAFCTTSLSAADDSLSVDRPWYAQVKGFEPPNSGEHPRLLFRRCDLPALRKKAQTTEGKAILERLRFLLDGKDGESMPTVFRPIRQASGVGGAKNKVPDKPGIYTMSHVAGYGLLYQLTGDKKYDEPRSGLRSAVSTNWR